MPSITELGFTLNRREADTANLNRVDNPNTTVEIPISQVNQEIQDSSVDMAKLNPLYSGQTTFNTGIGFWLGIDDGTPKFSIGDPDNGNVNWNGSTLAINGTILLNSSLDEVTNARVSDKSMLDIERMVQTSPGASADNGTYFQITTAALDNSLASFTQTAIGRDFNTLSLESSNPEFWVIAKWNAATAQEGFIGFCDGTFSGGSLEDHILTLDHFGFIVQDGTLYASCADGTTQTVTDISSGITITEGHAYWGTFDGTTAKLYVDGTLKATLTTNVPDNNLQTFIMAVIADASAAAKEFEVQVTGRYAWDI